jgi:hypothetical protein
LRGKFGDSVLLTGYQRSAVSSLAAEAAGVPQLGSMKRRLAGAKAERPTVRLSERPHR